jgi:DNA-binding transcriptional ArsR family regulator
METTKVIISSDKLDYSCELMRALAHPLRLKILDFLDKNEDTNVNQIYNSLDLEQSITSQHLKILKLAGVLNVQKSGKFMKYTINYDILVKAQNAVNRFLGKNMVATATAV